MIGVGNKQTIYQNTDNAFSVPIISVWIRLEISSVMLVYANCSPDKK